MEFNEKILERAGIEDISFKCFVENSDTLLFCNRKSNLNFRIIRPFFIVPFFGNRTFCSIKINVGYVKKISFWLKFIYFRYGPKNLFLDDTEVFFINRIECGIQFLFRDVTNPKNGM